MKSATRTISLALIIAMAITLLASTAGFALDVTPIPNPTPEQDPAESPSDSADGDCDGIADKAPFFEKLALAFPELGLTTEQLQALSEQGWGLGEIITAVTIASDSSKTLDEIAALSEQGLGWGEVARVAGIQAKNLGQLVSSFVRKNGFGWKNAEEDIEDAVSGQGHRYGHAKNDAKNGEASGQAPTPAAKNQNAKGQPDKGNKSSAPGQQQKGKKK